MLSIIHSMLRPLLYFLLLGTQLFGLNVEWLPQGSIYPTAVFDPRAAIQGISMLNYDIVGDDTRRAYVPVTLSMEQQFLRKQMSDDQLFELGMRFSMYSQWSIADVGEAFMGGLQNSDFRISALGTYHWDSIHFLQFSLFHQSSHLGDDYIIRNSITSPALRTLNYEQFDLSYSRLINRTKLYTGLGYNVSPNTVRGRTMLSAGVELAIPLQNHAGVSLKLGLHSNIYEQNDFSPNLRAGLGLELAGNTSSPFIVMISVFKGHLPYSTLEYQKVTLVGLSLVIPLSQP